MEKEEESDDDYSLVEEKSSEDRDFEMVTPAGRQTSSDDIQSIDTTADTKGRPLRELEIFG